MMFLFYLLAYANYNYKSDFFVLSPVHRFFYGAKVKIFFGKTLYTTSVYKNFYGRLGVLRIVGEFSGSGGG